MTGIFIGLGEVVSPPSAFAVFATTYPDQVVASGSFVPTGSPQEMRQLIRTNSQVNAEIAPAADVGDTWSIDVAQGDCDDYACTKRARLLKAGWPTATLLLAAVQIPSREFHLVLVARMPRGDLVLDNLEVALLSPIADHYRWIMIQDPADPLVWRDAILSREEEGQAA